MRLERIFYSLVIVIAVSVAAVNWRKAVLFQEDNDALRAKVEALEAETAQSAQAAEIVKTSAEKLRTQTSELAKLRNEVTQLRTTAKTAETLTAENQKLRAENQQLHARAGSGSTPAAPTQNASDNLAGRGQFPRDSWTFAGYASPENALVSAIWAMREGDPKTYLDSLAPQEQQRMAQNWQNKSETEIAEKHKSDVSSISGLRVLELQKVAPNEVLMNVYLEGPGRVEKVRMSQVGQDWKFGGFIRDAQQQAASPVKQ